MPIQPTPSTQDKIEGWWQKLVVSLELANLDDPATCERLDSAAAKANSQGLQAAAGWQYATALKMLSAAIEIWSRLGRVPGQVSALNTRGSVVRRLGQYDAALDDHRAALALAHADDLRLGEIVARVGMAAALVELADFDPAQRLLDEALDQATATVDNWGLAHAQHIRGRAYEGLKDWSAARDAYAAALDQNALLMAAPAVVEVQAGLARVALASGYTADALALIEAVLAYLGEHGPDRLEEPLRVYWSVVRVMTVAGQPEAARQMLLAAYQMVHKQALELSIAQRGTFLDGVAVNRAIVAAWEES